MNRTYVLLADRHFTQCFAVLSNEPQALSGKLQAFMFISKQLHDVQWLFNSGQALKNAVFRSADTPEYCGTLDFNTAKQLGER